MKFLLAALLLVGAQAHAEKVTVAVKGMHCSSCAGDIEDKFKKVPEVKGVHASFKKSNVVLETAGVKDVTDQQINDVIKDAGFKVAKISRSEK
jgi:copper chaperone CopZ